jgi:flagellar motor switch protein FliG
MSAAAVQLTGARKVAALLVALGTEASARIVALLPEEAVERVASEVLKTPTLEDKVRTALVAEAFEQVAAEDGTLHAGEGFALRLLGEAFGSGRAQELVSRVNQGERFETLKAADPAHVAEVLSTEHPQTIALVLAHLDPAASAAIMMRLEPALQPDVARRMARTDQISPDAIAAVEAGLERRMSTVVSGAGTAVGGVRPVANVLNRVDRRTERLIMDAIAEHDAELVAEIRRFMFVFDDLARLDDRSMQRVIRDIDQKDLALALRAAPEAIKNQFFRNMSQRAAEMVREEMSLSGPVRMTMVEEAQTRILEIVKRLEEQEEIVLDQGGAERDVLV